MDNVDYSAIDRFMALGIPATHITVVARALSRFGQQELGTAIEVLIALMDLRDGDPDAEEDDPGEEDDESGQATEDEISCGTGSFGWGGPTGAGCPISDPGGCEHDGREPHTYND